MASSWRMRLSADVEEGEKCVKMLVGKCDCRKPLGTPTCNVRGCGLVLCGSERDALAGSGVHFNGILGGNFLTT
jgi:hypothetical protein